MFVQSIYTFIHFNMNQGGTAKGQPIVNPMHFKSSVKTKFLQD